MRGLKGRKVKVTDNKNAPSWDAEIVSDPVYVADPDGDWYVVVLTEGRLLQVDIYYLEVLPE